MFDYSHLLNYMHPSYLTGNPAWGGGFFNNLGSVPPWMFGGGNSGQPGGGGFDPTGLPAWATQRGFSPLFNQMSGGMPGVGAPGTPNFGQVDLGSGAGNVPGFPPGLGGILQSAQNSAGGGTNSLGLPPWLMNSLQAARGGPTNFGQLLGNVTPQVGSTTPSAGMPNAGTMGGNLGGYNLPGTSFNNGSMNVTGVGNPNPPTSFFSPPPNLTGGGTIGIPYNNPNIMTGGGVRYNG